MCIDILYMMYYTVGMVQESPQSHTAQKQAAKPRRKVIELKNVSRTYKRGASEVKALQDVSAEIYAGEMVAIVGTSGSGKSTLLHTIGGLDSPTSGEVWIDGKNLKQMRDGELSRYRGRKIGFVFQSFYLQPFLNTQKNIEVPAMFANIDRTKRHQNSQDVAHAVGIEDRLKHYPAELSGGQIQRTAIARALVNQPPILLADEPTGNLDQKNAHAIFDLFAHVRDTLGTTVIVVTHDEQLAARMDRVIRITDGRVSQ